MDRELYGREAILGADGLAARLTGLAPNGSARVAYEHRDDPPVAVLTGGRGMGKTAVLKQLRRLYREVTPVALVDCEAVVPPADPGPGWTPVTGALPELAAQLTARVRAARPVPFPRLSLGLVRSPRSPGRGRTRRGRSGTSRRWARCWRPSTPGATRRRAG
ncbi:hypothetical protein ACF1FX_26290 [Streptomyces sp. NPDC014646]|uniref:hypothetical protein n=1 Tax=Streptomyces sp. NPDC014646 TaxID=3364877 RepID=UPI0036F7DCBD